MAPKLSQDYNPRILLVCLFLRVFISGGPKMVCCDQSCVIMSKRSQEFRASSTCSPPPHLPVYLLSMGSFKAQVHPHPTPSILSLSFTYLTDPSRRASTLAGASTHVSTLSSQEETCSLTEN